MSVGEIRGEQVPSSERAPSSRAWWWYLVLAVVVVWALAVLVYAANVLLIAAYGDQSCPVVPGGSDYGELEFNLAPPGFQCRFVDPVTGDTYVTERPDMVRMLMQLTVVAVPVAAWWSTTRLRDGSGPRRRRTLLVIVAVTVALVAVGSLLSLPFHDNFHSYGVATYVVLVGSLAVMTVAWTLAVVSFARSRVARVDDLA